MYLRAVLGVLGAAVFAVACGSSDGGSAAPEKGTEGNACRPNRECDDGLTCLSNVCVVPEGGAGSSNAGSGAGGGDAGAGDTGGSDEGGKSAGGSGGSVAGAPAGGGGGAPPEPECVTVNLTNAVANEKTNAAFCFGMAYPDQYSCSFNQPNNSTLCSGTKTEYIVLWNGIASGDVYDTSNEQGLASLSQGKTGAFIIEWLNGDYGECTVVGDVATLCFTPASK